MTFLLFWGWGVFLKKILPIIVLKHNLQLSPVMFAPICVPMIRQMR